MKTRSSLNKAHWSETREKGYQEFCDQILFDKKLEIRINGDEVYLKSADEERLFMIISKPKSTWYEIWVQLKTV
jgi:hypothetical protein